MSAYAYIAAVIALSIAGWEKSGSTEFGRDTDYWHGNEVIDVNIWWFDDESGSGWRIGCYTIANDSTQDFFLGYDFKTDYELPMVVPQ